MLQHEHCQYHHIAQYSNIVQLQITRFVVLRSDCKKNKCFQKIGRARPHPKSASANICKMNTSREEQRMYKYITFGQLQIKILMRHNLLNSVQCNP